MRWYLNDASLQGQFSSADSFLETLRALLDARAGAEQLRRRFYLARTTGSRPVVRASEWRQVIFEARDQKLKSAVLYWLDRNGPFVENDRFNEPDDYFEYLGVDVTDSGLGEAARRFRTEDVASFSFSGGAINYGRSPLEVQHGLSDEVLGLYPIQNFWCLADLVRSAAESLVLPDSWQSLIEYLRIRYTTLLIPDHVYQDTRLAKEPFDTVIRDRTIVLFGHLHSYMMGRNEDGSEGPQAARIVQDYFVGERAPFSGESVTNRRDYAAEMTFVDPEDESATIFAHWHGKISHRYFRFHFEWPLQPDAKKLKVLYLGPKLTKG